MQPQASALADYYQIIDHRHALSLLQNNYPNELSELTNALLGFRLSEAMLLAKGGNESEIPKRFSHALRPLGWSETRISGDLLVRLAAKHHGTKGLSHSHFVIDSYLDGHKIDYVKGAVAFDLEWNAKDQTFDRDLYAFRAFYEAGVIAVGVLVTRAEELNEHFKRLGIMAKYGASTTWMGKLEYRLRANRGGGCPILALGITSRLLTP